MTAGADTAWLAHAKWLHSLDVEIGFLLADPASSPSLEPLTTPRKIDRLLRTSEAIGHEDELAAYYRRCIHDARRRNRSFNEYSHLFWMMKPVLEALQTRAPGQLLFDVEQGWSMEIVLHDSRIYIRQGDDVGSSDDDAVMASVSRELLAAQAQPLMTRTEAIIARLAKELGEDVWTTRKTNPFFRR